MHVLKVDVKSDAATYNNGVSAVQNRGHGFGLPAVITCCQLKRLGSHHAHPHPQLTLRLFCLRRHYRYDVAEEQRQSDHPCATQFDIPTTIMSNKPDKSSFLRAEAELVLDLVGGSVHEVVT